MNKNQYTQADNEAFAAIWCPKPGTPYTYEVRKSNYNYDERRWNFELFKQIEGSYAIQISQERGASQGTIEGLYEMARISGDIDQYFDNRNAIQRAKFKEAEDAKRKIKELEREKYWAERDALLAAIVAECDAEMMERKQKQRAY